MEVASARPGDQLSDDQTHDDEHSDRATASRSGAGTALLMAVVVLGVLVGVAGLVVPRVLGTGGEDPDREAVVSRVNEFASVYNTYDVAQLDDYQQRMEPLLTTGYFEEFQRITDAVFGALESKDQKSGDANVLSVAVETIDDDSAVAIVAVDAAITTASDEAAVQRRFRWKVTLSKVGDSWLVNQFETVVPLDATTGAEGDDAGETDGTTPPATPSASPTPSASDEGADQ